MLPVVKTVFKIAGSFFLATACLATAIMASNTQPLQVGAVTARVLNIRSGPGKSYPVISKIKKEGRLVILAYEPDWLKVSFDGREGFVWREYIRIIPVETSTNETTPAPFDPAMDFEVISTLKQESGRIHDQIADQEEQVSAYTEKETRLIDELDRVGRLLNETRIQAKDTEERVLTIEIELRKTMSECSALEKEIALLDVYAAKRLVALYKLNQLGKLPVLASTDSIYELLNRKSALERILAADKAVWQELTTKKERFDTLQNKLDKQKKTYDEQMKTLNEQMATMHRQNEARSQLLEEIRGEKALTLAAIDSLRQAAVELDRQIESYDWEVHPAGVSGNKKPFPTLKGLLQTPVTGRITGFYGLNKSDSLKAANYRNGIDIQASPGEPIRAVHDGTTVFADWFKGYGNMIIIDHGDDFCTIYAHAEELFKSKGDEVDSSEVIGTVGDTGSMAGTRLYFEIRHEGKPIDPLAWLKRN